MELKIRENIFILLSVQHMSSEYNEINQIKPKQIQNIKCAFQEAI